MLSGSHTNQKKCGENLFLINKEVEDIPYYVFTYHL